jgi:hypothetical protein
MGTAFKNIFSKSVPKSKLTLTRGKISKLFFPAFSISVRTGKCVISEEVEFLPHGYSSLVGSILRLPNQVPFQFFSVENADDYLRNSGKYVL